MFLPRSRSKPTLGRNPTGQGAGVIPRTFFSVPGNFMKGRYMAIYELATIAAPAVLPDWQDQYLDQRQRDEIRLARFYANGPHGTDGHNRLLLIARLAELLDMQLGGPEPAGNWLAVWLAFKRYALKRGNSHHMLRVYDDESGRVLDANDNYVFVFGDFAQAIRKLDGAAT